MKRKTRVTMISAAFLLSITSGSIYAVRNIPVGTVNVQELNIESINEYTEFAIGGFENDFIYYSLVNERYIGIKKERTGKKEKIVTDKGTEERYEIARTITDYSEGELKEAKINILGNIIEDSDIKKPYVIK